MRVVIAPDSFKDALSAQEAAKAIAHGIKQAYPVAETIECPLGDGGEGTLDAILAASNAIERTLTVHDALGRSRQARWGLIKTPKHRSAIIELAEASGLQHLTASERNACITSTQGVGELIKDALDAGVDHILLTIGGSATNDGGTGMMTALGARFLDAEGRELSAGGAALTRLARIDLTGKDPRLANIHVQTAVDVINPLTGKQGASAVFGPQKGANQEDVLLLDHALGQLADVTAATIDTDYRDTPGAGAAGGMGFAALAFLGAQLRPGIELVMEHVQFESMLQGADLLIVGEGGLDNQSLSGKTPIGAARVAKHLGVPCVALVGNLGHGWQAAHEEGICAAFALAEGPTSLENALTHTAENLSSRSAEIIRLWCTAQGVDL